jgi:pimeloyl-ACP methyl ester carboxylesterase
MNKSSAANSQLGKSFKTVFPAAVILVAGLIVLFSVLVYKISNPGALPESVNPSHYLLPSLDVSVPSAKGEMIPAWWIPGLKGAPGIVLAPGYGMNRGDALSLAVALRNRGFNLLIYSQRGNGSLEGGSSSLGIYENGDMLSAVRFIRDRDEINRESIGIWGVDIGARAALMAVRDFPEIRAIAADSAYQFPSDFLSYRIQEDFGLESRFLQFGCNQVFRLWHFSKAREGDSAFPLQALSDRNILFITGENRKKLAPLSAAVYDAIKPQKELVSFKTARVHSMSGEDLINYDRQVSNFFYLNLR